MTSNIVSCLAASGIANRNFWNNLEPDDSAINPPAAVFGNINLWKVWPAVAPATLVVNWKKAFSAVDTSISPDACCDCIFCILPKTFSKVLSSVSVINLLDLIHVAKDWRLLPPTPFIGWNNIS